MASKKIVVVGYYLNEDNRWSVEVCELERAKSDGKTHCYLRAILVINPGNPTGQVLTRKNIEEVIRFANRENLLIIACEVYQDSVYEEGVFHSFKKVVFEMGAPYNHTELVSLMSSPKGYAGESGMRAGYLELNNVSPSIRDLLRSSISIADSPPICAQIALDCMASPPQPVHPSYSLFQQERTAFIDIARKRAKSVCRMINSITGLSCCPIQGGFFAFVKVNLPPRVIEKANRLNQCPSTFYVLEMLEESGVLTVPGERFGQSPESYHFRLAILLPEGVLEDALQRIRDFHLNFIDQYK